MDQETKKLKESLIEFGKLINQNNLVVGPGGNLSIRVGDVCYITPSGLSFTEIKSDDLVGIDIESNTIISGTKRPSSETLMHISIYKVRKEINAIFHIHPPYTIAVVGADIEIKPLFPDFALYLGEKVKNIEYVTPCTAELATIMAKEISNVDAIAMKKHGLTVIAKNMKEAWVKTLLVEESDKMIVAARTVGKEAVITKEEIDKINNLEIEQYRKKLMKDN